MKKLASVTTHRDKDAGGTEDQLTSFLYDGTGRLLKTTFPDASYEQTTWQYGQVSAWRVRKGATKTISYDARGREISHTWDDPNTPGITRSWDDANRISSIANSNSTISYTYDKAGQVASESSTVTGAGGAAVLSYARYPDGAESLLTYPSGFKLRRDYTARQQLSSTGSADANGNWMTQFASYSYLADGKVNSESYGNGVSTALGYDGRGFVTSTNTTKASAVYSNRTYYRDNRDRIYAWAKSNNTASNPLENGRGDRYTYDAESQLTAASYQATTPNGTPGSPQRTESFVYDQLGNRKGVNTLAARGNVAFHRRDNGVNQYLDWTPASITYESNGDLTQEGNINATFNALNQPISISSSAVPSGMAFAFDPLGRCVKRTNGTSTYFYYDGWDLIQEGSTSASADRIYAHGNRVDEVVAQQAGGNWAYHHYDARGHCILLTNASGGLLEQYDYDAFGKPYFYDGSGNSLPNGSGFGNRFLFTGREWIKELSIYDYRNRQYQPELGRFLQPDPKEFDAGDYNLYRYCHNDPVNKSDPMGLSQGGPSLEDLKKKILRLGRFLFGPLGENRSVPANVTRTVIEVAPLEGESATSTVVRFRYDVTDGNGKPVRYAPVKEAVCFAPDGVCHAPPGVTGSHSTDGYGRAYDTYKIPFYCPRGQCTILQGLMIGNGESMRSGQWETIVRANLSYDLRGQTQMSLH